MKNDFPYMNEGKFPAHQMHHEAMKKHEDGGHKHHSGEFMKHGAGHQFEQEKVKAMCGGGMTRK
jgi:hypothetical protein